MLCPNCSNVKLKQYITPNGIELDFCPKCNGNWLDKGEILFFVDNKKFVENELKKSFKKSTPTNKLSPISKNPMETISYFDELKIEHCKQSGGLWFDKEEFAKFSKISNLKALDYEKLNIDDELINKTSIYFEEEKKETKEQISLIKLPNLVFTSVITMVSVFSLFTIFFLAILSYFNIGLYISIGISLLFSFIGLFVGPMFYDFSITTFMSGKLIPFEKLPNNIQKLSDSITVQYNIKTPEFYIIKDGAPQAFTYGYSPNSSRIVISEGLLNLLNDDEVDSVVAHEFGHIIHWDMVLMSILMVIPKISYLIYKHFVEQLKNGERDSLKKDDKKGAAQSALIALAAYIVFYISQLFVLYFSRVREYHADRFSANFTKSPHSLSNALIKIGYGLIKTSDKKTEKEHTLSSSPLNIFDNRAVPSFAISSFSCHQNQDNINELKEVMKWDLWNPWSSWYELNSTHPLIANRLIALSNVAEAQNKKPFFIIDDEKPESYYDDFLIDFIIYIIPIISIMFFVFYNLILTAMNLSNNSMYGAVALSIFGIGSIIKNLYSYRSFHFPEMSVSALLKKIKVSEVRPIPCKIKGKIIGKGIPGYIASEDFIMQDETGILYVDYKQPLGLWEFFFGLFKADGFVDKEVEVEGWYRRAPIPFLEIKSIKAINEELDSSSSFRYFQLMLFSIVSFGALFWLSSFF